MAAPLVIILSLCYSLTIAPGLTWAHFSADGGDFIAAVATGGVPHPSGYPLYLILARPFQLIPVGALAFRTNLMSAVSTILASLVLYKFLVHHLQGCSRGNFISFFAALAFGLAPFVWGQALVTEVYALHGLLMIVCLYILSIERPIAGEWAKGFIFGIAATNHLTSIMMFPLILLSFKGNLFISQRIFLTRCLGILSGLSLYLILPVRAYFSPPVNWGNASTINGFFWLISGRLYSDNMSNLAFTDIIQRFRAFAGLLLEQYTWISVLLGIYGLFCLSSRPLRIASIWMAVSFLFFSIFYGSYDSQVYLLPVWLVFAIWLAYGLQDLFELLRNRFKLMEVPFAALLFISLMTRIPFSLHQVDVSEDFSVQDFITQTLDGIPKDSLVFIDGDQQVFSLWYAQLALHQRTDIIFIARGLLPYKWYIESLYHTYPNVNILISDKLQPTNLISANPNRTVCYVSANRPLICRHN